MSLDHIELCCNGEILIVDMPYAVDVRGMSTVRRLADPSFQIEQALKHPIGARPLAAIAAASLARNTHARAVVVVSDNTRPVPYAGPSGILTPILSVLRDAGFADSSITILIGNGSHRALIDDEIERMLGIHPAQSEISIVNHDYNDNAMLARLGTTARGSVVEVNRLYFEADVKIVTGLVESHFIAGASGGRKGICPAIVGRTTLETFHGASLLASPNACDLVLDGNPCSDESYAVARIAGCDFLVNVTLDSDGMLTGIYCGDIRKAHEAAVAKIREYVTVHLEKAYDIVVVPGGHVAVNHYQSAKAVEQAARAVKRGGRVILAAHHSDPDPVGSPHYKHCMKLVVERGINGFMDLVTSSSWEFALEQWQAQLWCRALAAIGKEENYLHCSAEISPAVYQHTLPGRSGMVLLKDAEICFPWAQKMAAMVRRGVEDAVRKHEAAGVRSPSVLFLKDGPYGVVVRA